jgi:hypothetical protein
MIAGPHVKVGRIVELDSWTQKADVARANIRNRMADSGPSAVL